jgi:hypothetical protein|tara:strand:+ start:265 stop:489 length:225 start_codon:yes stop_codon:yes gene_type:complete
MTNTTTKYKVGDYVLGDGSVRPGATGLYTYEVLEVEERPRFGKPSQLLTVNKYANTLKGKSFVEKERRWSTQLF